MFGIVGVVVVTGMIADALIGNVEVGVGAKWDHVLEEREEVIGF